MNEFQINYKKINSWYLSDFIIIILSFFWFLYGVPLVIAIGLSIWKFLLVRKSKVAFTAAIDQFEDNDAKLKLAEKNIEELNGLELFEINQKIESLKTEYEEKSIQLEESHRLRMASIAQDEQQAQGILDAKKLEVKSLDEKLKELSLSIRDIDDMASFEEYGMHTPKYSCMNSDEYAGLIKDLRVKQKEMIRSKSALSYFNNWTVDGSKSKGTAMNNDNMKMVLRAFNNECDVLISKVKFNNIEAIRAKIKKAAEQIDRLNKRNRISIKPQYVNLKLDELDLVYEHAVKKQEEKEAMRAARAEEREAAKLAKEIAEARAKLMKEQTHYGNALKELSDKLALATDQDEITELNLKITEINGKLQEINKGMQDIDYREANQRAGYVYVISNIGSFGEDVYKIGMTRRLEPQDRIDELSSASVPFNFDVHAMIFSDDAPSLETALHNAFDDKKINLVNGRKEFFKVQLEDIEKEVKKNHTKLVEFNDTADAEQYRETKMLLKQSLSA